jgi:hypothetical protein
MKELHTYEKKKYTYFIDKNKNQIRVRGVPYSAHAKGREVALPPLKIQPGI